MNLHQGLIDVKGIRSSTFLTLGSSFVVQVITVFIVSLHPLFEMLVDECPDIK